MTQPHIRELNISSWHLRALKKCEEVPFKDDEGRVIYFASNVFKWNTVLSYFVAKKYKSARIIVIVNGMYGASKALLVPNEIFDNIGPGKRKFSKAVFSQWRAVGYYKYLEHEYSNISSIKTRYTEDIIELKTIINRLNRDRHLIVSIDKEELITDHREILKEYVRTIP